MARKDGGKPANKEPTTVVQKNKSIPPPTREENILKRITLVLKHGALQARLELTEQGYANCGDLKPLQNDYASPLIDGIVSSILPPLTTHRLPISQIIAQLSWYQLRSLNVTFPEIRTLVESMQPGSFDLIAIPSLTVLPDLDAVEQDDEPYYVSCLNSLNPVQHLIRAKPLRPRGSLRFFPEATLALLDSRSPKFPQEVVHGTPAASWPEILASPGLEPKGRKHVHIATSVAAAPASLTDEEVQKPKAANKMRKNAELLIWVDTKLSEQRGGHIWYRSADGVVSTAADPTSMVGIEWFKRVVRMADRVVMWEPVVDWSAVEIGKNSNGAPRTDII